MDLDDVTKEEVKEWESKESDKKLREWLDALKNSKHKQLKIGENVVNLDEYKLFRLEMIDSPPSERPPFYSRVVKYHSVDKKRHHYYEPIDIYNAYRATKLTK